MNIKEIYRQHIETRLESLVKFVTYGGAIITSIGWSLEIYNWGNSLVFNLIRGNIIAISAITAAVSIISLYIRLERLSRMFITRFSDRFTGDLRYNWDFIGPWRIVAPNTLLVTGSDEGGLTKVGATWENYTLTFDARIQNQCLGVIIRAQDLNNYYMLQINRDRIRPHRRASIPVADEIELIQVDENGEDKPHKINGLRYIIGWQIFELPQYPINKEFEGWFNVKVIVKGESVSLYIDDELYMQKDSFLKISTGKIGFRNNGEESALVKNVNLIIDP